MVLCICVQLLDWSVFWLVTVGASLGQPMSWKSSSAECRSVWLRLPLDPLDHHTHTQCNTMNIIASSNCRRTNIHVWVQHLWRNNKAERSCSSDHTLKDTLPVCVIGSETQQWRCRCSERSVFWSKQTSQANRLWFQLLYNLLPDSRRELLVVVPH